MSRKFVYFFQNKCCTITKRSKKKKDLKMKTALFGFSMFCPIYFTHYFLPFPYIYMKRIVKTEFNVQYGVLGRHIQNKYCFDSLLLNNFFFSTKKKSCAHIFRLLKTFQTMSMLMYIHCRHIISSVLCERLMFLLHALCNIAIQLHTQNYFIWKTSSETYQNVTSV